ncbi:serine protease 27 isoform X2 [Kryptolebias marmoratus]|uniref:Plasma kallikrein-like n=1 Tax=Kryptolebias marmoratus TaxID=37003 RepID=A0A3Q3BBD3_KRYMA|nr:serine protease 27 isoform X2 [Kryptolebias marmoratus]
MALQQFACVFTVTLILLCKGCHSQTPACSSPVINSRIIGGQDAAEGRWPWHAVFKSSGRDFCQGSLITDQWVLTAAQCFIYYFGRTSVHLGVHNQSGFNPNEVTRRVEYFVCHQDFNTSTYEHDICLVKLSAPVNFTDYIRPVCLAAENSIFSDETICWVTGFGYDENWKRPEILQEVDVPIIENKICSFYFKNGFYYYGYYSRYAPTENKLCAGQEDGLKEAFYYDEGAALVTKKNSTWVQSGIVSFTFSSWMRLPTVYTRVSRYQKWISDKVTGMKPGFVTFNSPGTLKCGCPTSANDKSIFGSGANLIPIAHLVPLAVLVVFLHVFVGSGVV